MYGTRKYNEQRWSRLARQRTVPRTPIVEDDWLDSIGAASVPIPIRSTETINSGETHAVLTQVVAESPDPVYAPPIPPLALVPPLMPIHVQRVSEPLYQQIQSSSWLSSIWTPNRLIKTDASASISTSSQTRSALVASSHTAIRDPRTAVDAPYKRSTEAKPTTGTKRIRLDPTALRMWCPEIGLNLVEFKTLDPSIQSFAKPNDLLDIDPGCLEPREPLVPDWWKQLDIWIDALLVGQLWQKVLMLNGPCGSGKTHCIQHYICEKLKCKWIVLDPSDRHASLAKQIQLATTRYRDIPLVFHLDQITPATLLSPSDVACLEEKYVKNTTTEASSRTAFIPLIIECRPQEVQNDWRCVFHRWKREPTVMTVYVRTPRSKYMELLIRRDWMNSCLTMIGSDKLYEIILRANQDLRQMLLLLWLDMRVWIHDHAENSTPTTEETTKSLVVTRTPLLAPRRDSIPLRKAPSAYKLKLSTSLLSEDEASATTVNVYLQNAFYQGLLSSIAYVMESSALSWSDLQAFAHTFGSPRILAYRLLDLLYCTSHPATDWTLLTKDQKGNLLTVRNAVKRVRSTHGFVKNVPRPSYYSRVYPTAAAAPVVSSPDGCLTFQRPSMITVSNQQLNANTETLRMDHHRNHVSQRLAVAYPVIDTLSSTEYLDHSIRTNPFDDHLESDEASGLVPLLASVQAKSRLSILGWNPQQATTQFSLIGRRLLELSHVTRPVYLLNSDRL